MFASFRRRMSGFWIGMCLCAVIGGGCLFAALRTEYDTVIRHFEEGAVLAGAASLICIIGVLLSVAAAVAVGVKKLAAAPIRGGSVSIFAATLLGFLLFASFILGIGTLTDAGAGWLARIQPALGGLSAFYFLAMVTQKDGGSVSPLTALLSLIPIVYAFFSVMTVYFDQSYAMNAPVKSCTLMMYITMALFFTAEARLTLGRQRTASYVLFAGLCVVLCGAVSIGKTLAMLTGGSMYGFSLMEGASGLSCALFAAVRLFTLADVAGTAQESPAGEPAQEVTDENN